MNKVIFKIQRKQIKNTYISVSSKGVLIKTNYNTTVKQIQNIINKKLNWINKKLLLFKQRRDNDKKIPSKLQIYYMGKNYTVKISSNINNQEISIAFKHFSFYVTTPLRYSHIEFNKALNSFYKLKAIEKITPIVTKCSKIMEAVPTHIGFRYAKTRWGSCSSKNRISLNYHLIKLPIHLIEYIIVHELAHITHHNHSKDFWALVQKYLPDYKDKERQIKKYEKMF